MTVVKLTRAIKYGENELSELELREPTAKDIRELGFPFDIANQDVKPDVIFKFAARLAALPPSVVDKISAADFMQTVTPAIINFFGGGQE